MDDVKENEKSNVSVSDDTAPVLSVSEPEPEPKAESAPASTPAPAATPASPAPPTKDQETELIVVNALLLIGLVGAMLYVGTVVFAADALLFFLGIFVYLIVAPPGTYVQGKSKMVSFTKEVACAFALTFVLFLLLKQFMPADADQAKWLTIVLATLGVKLVFYPYYNFKADD
ncbi:hypothetical protein KF707_14995 [Candidatus Obscuribacterales bacterium]|nr:hypothetical protein [Candidatus Obscuribacterales bacterium]MBX3137528.1 hypothetical protein [Candidatus Obscuribacterales bacterium]